MSSEYSSCVSGPGTVTACCTSSAICSVPEEGGAAGRERVRSSSCQARAARNRSWTDTLQAMENGPIKAKIFNEFDEKKQYKLSCLFSTCISIYPPRPRRRAIAPGKSRWPGQTRSIRTQSPPVDHRSVVQCGGAVQTWTGRGQRKVSG